ncbi:MAG: DUF1583 domain-containing protein, partial [Planctomycetota bacterium]
DELAETLLDIVLPPGRRGEVVPLVRPVFQANAKAAQDGRVQADSMSRLLVEVAQGTEYAERIAEALATQGVDGPAVLANRLVAVQLACASGDLQAIEDALSSLASAAGMGEGPGAIPEASWTNTVRPSPAEIKQIDLIVHALESANQASPHSPEAWRIMRRLARKLIVSRHATDLNYWTRQLRRRVADHDTPDSVATDAAECLVDMVIAHVPKTQPQRLIEQEFAARTDIAYLALGRGQIGVAARMMRRSARIWSQSPSVSGGDYLARYLMTLQHLSASQQYRFLQQVMCGDESPDSRPELINLVARPVYESPPESLQMVTPRLADAGSIVTDLPSVPVCSTAAMIADAAARSGMTEKWIAKLEALRQTEGDSTDAMIGLALMADDRADEADIVLQRVVSHLHSAKRDAFDPNGFPFAAITLIAHLLEKDPDHLAARSALSGLQQRVQASQMGLVHAYTALLSRLQLGLKPDASPSPTLRHWVTLPWPDLATPNADVHWPTFELNEKTIVRPVGDGRMMLMLRYPLQGEVQANIVGRLAKGGTTGGLGLGLNGRSYKTSNGREILFQGLGNRGSKGLSARGKQGQKTIPLALSATEGSVELALDGQTLVRHPQTTTSFLSLVLDYDGRAEMNSLSVSLSQAIPRRVELINPNLDGWACLTYGGSLRPLTDTSVTQVNSPIRINLLKSSNLTRRSRPSVSYTWDVSGKSLVIGARPADSNRGGMSHIQHLRPLCEGESVTYNAKYRAGMVESHPTLGRTAFLIRPDGVKLRWLARSDSLDSVECDSLHEVEPALMLPTAKEMKLKPSDWNEFKLTSERATVLLTVNGIDVCRVEKTRNQQIGLMREANREVEVKSILLEGDWPERLPANLLED